MSTEMDCFPPRAGSPPTASKKAEGIHTSHPATVMMKPYGDRSMDQRLVEVFGNLVFRFESIIHSTAFENFRTQLDEILLLLRVWATDIRADQSSDPNCLDLLESEYEEEAVAVRIHMHMISESLEALEQQAATAKDNIEIRLQRSAIEELRTVVQELTDLTESIQICIDILRQQGSTIRVKSAIIERPPTSVRATSSVLDNHNIGSFPFDSANCPSLPLSNDSIAVESTLSPEDSNSYSSDGSTDDAPKDDSLMWSGEAQAGSERRDSTPQWTPPLRRRLGPAKGHQNPPSRLDTDMDSPEVMVVKAEELDDEESGEDVPFQTDEGEGGGASGARNAPLTTVPRKRGRPRKHPLPTPGGQMKAAKGKSKTGCITCRRRKKECDETKPDCLNCQKNAVVCEGYPPKDIWKSGNQKMEESVRQSSPSIPRDLPILIDGIETGVDRRFLDHFVHGFSRVLALINDDSNPFKEILPMATQHKGLMHSLMCLAGLHLSANCPEPQYIARIFYHFDCAVVTVTDSVNRLTSDKTQLVVQEPGIASTIALFLMTICEGDTSGQLRAHMDAARFLIIAQAQRADSFSNPRIEKLRECIMEFLRYYGVSSLVTLLDSRPFETSGDLHLPDFVPYAQAGAFLGIFDSLINYISVITKIRDYTRQRYNEGYEPALDYRTLRAAVMIDSELRAWEPSYPPDTLNWYAAQLYRQSTWVYLYCTIRPSRPNEKLSDVVNGGLWYLDQIPRNTGTYSITLMPLFLLGCSAFERPQQDRIQRGFDDLLGYSNLRNTKPSLKVVKRVWEVMDTHVEDSWNWEMIIKEMEMDFMIT